MSQPESQYPGPSAAPTGTSRGWTLLLVVPYFALCFPQLYTRLTPVLWGFPFFYWYQFLWVLVTSALLAVVYLKIKS